MKKKIKPRLIIHGGAGSGKGNQKVRFERIRSICKRVQKKLIAGGSALESVVLAVRLMEDSPLFNAGYGSKLQIDGKVRCTACLMDGETERFAAVVNVTRYKNPILIVRNLVEQEHRVLGSKGAEKFARSMGIKPSNTIHPDQLRIWKQRQKGSHGTVGAVAMDSAGHLAAASSTGGIGNEMVGRIGDNCSPAACFCTSKVGVAVTGMGEKITDTALASRIGIRIIDGMNPKQALKQSFLDLEKIGGEAGAICITRSGKISARFNTQTMIWAASEIPIWI